MSFVKKNVVCFVLEWMRKTSINFTPSVIILPKSEFSVFVGF